MQRVLQCALSLVSLPLVLSTCAADGEPESKIEDRSTETTSIVAFTGATVIDGTGAPPLEDATVVIDGEKLACVGVCGVPSDAEVMDAAGQYIIPGLVDVHVHYGATGWVDGFPGLFPGIDVSERHPYPEVLADLRENPERFHRSYLCSGVTAVYNPGGHPFTLGFREEAEHSTAAPHFASAGPLLTSLEQVIPHPAASAMSVQMTDEETVRETIRMLAERRVDGVKIHRPDLIQDRGLRRALLEAAGEEAERTGLTVIANTPSLESAKEVLRAGASLFVYPVEDTLIDEEFIELARDNELVYASGFEVGVGGRELQARNFREDRLPLDCVDPETRRKALFTDSLPRGAERADPEIIPARDDEVHQTREQNFLRLHESGIAVAVGASGGAPLTLHGPATTYEMRAMQEAGLTPMEVLVAATRNGAKAMGRLDDFGTLEEGKVADLVVLERNPLEDISNVLSIARVVRGGKVWTREELEYR